MKASAKVNWARANGYLNSRSITHGGDSSGVMSISAVATMTATNHKYGLAFSENETDHNKAHITAIIGYSSSSTNDLYIMFDPHGSGSCKISISSTARTFSSSGIVYHWDYGYLSNISA